MFLHNPANKVFDSFSGIARLRMVGHITNMSYTINELRDLVDRHRGTLPHGAAVPGLRLQHAAAPNPRINTIYRPSLCLLAQGSKQVFLGDEVFAYDSSQYLIVTVDLPVTGCIVEASRECPYLGISLDLDPELIADLLLEIPAEDDDAPAVSGLTVSHLDEDLLDAAVRLLQLLDRPDDTAIMAPLIKREIHYRLLRGEQGTILRSVLTADSHLSRISRAIEWIRLHYEEPVSISELATQASM